MENPEDASRGSVPTVAATTASVAERRLREAEAYRAGLSVDEIAAREGVPRRRVYADLEILGVPRRELGSASVEQKELRRVYAAAHGLLTTDDVAARVGCAAKTVARYAHEGRLEGIRYPGPWNSARPWLLRPEAAATMRLLLEERERARRQRAAESARARHALGTFRRPRRGREVTCVCGCGKTFYRRPYRLLGRNFYSPTCSDKDRWRYGIGLQTLAERWSGRARQRWLGRWGGSKAPGPGARPRGKPRGYTDAQVKTARILRERDPNIGRGRLARLLRVSEKQARAILTELDG